MKWLNSLCRRIYKLLLVLFVICTGLLVGGFVKFADTVSKNSYDTAAATDGVVVLTGGAQRITTAISLMERNKGKRLLISGVNENTTQKAIQRAIGSNSPAFDCCVDVGYQALDTKGNAEETAAWVKRNGYSSIILVTSNYHMPRALLELRAAMPDVEISGHGVISDNIDSKNWLTDIRTLRVYLSEYTKYLAAHFNVRVSQVVGDENAKLFYVAVFASSH